MMLQQIPYDEIIFEPSSLVDEVGRVFWRQGNVYRAISQQYAQFHTQLFTEKNIQVAFDHGLIPTEIAPFSLDGYGLVLQHHRVPVTSYCMEWSSEMLRDAALLICDLSIHLYEQGLVLKDVHPWNILFDGGTPFYVDWGSIVPIDRSRAWPYPELRGWYILPLCLMAADMSQMARTLMLGVGHRPVPGDVFRLLANRLSWSSWLRNWVDDKKHSRMQLDVHFFQSLRRTIQAIPAPRESTEWTNYCGLDNKFSFDAPDEWPAKVRNVEHLLNTLQPETVLDIGCNRGWIAELAARKGVNVIAADLDEASINFLFRDVQQKQLSVLPLVMDICNPVPAHGLMHAYASAQTRLRSEMVLALAVTHHLVFKRGLSFESIARQLSAFSERWLVVEFVPPDDFHVSKWMEAQFSWYTLDGFRSALSDYFKNVQILDSTPAPRVLLFCEKK